MALEASSVEKALRHQWDLGDALRQLQVESATQLSTELSELHTLETVPWCQSVDSEPAWVAVLTALTAKHEDYRRVAFGPLEDLLQKSDSTLLAATTGLEALATIPQFMENHFRIPEIGEAALLASQLTGSLRFVEIEHQKTIGAVMERMKAPWLNVENGLESVKGFAALQDIGEVLRSPVSGFDDRIAATLRHGLGDWRDVIPLPAGIEDLLVRAAFYEDRGLDPNLTNFSALAFRESINIARLDDPPPAVIEIYNYHIPAESFDEEKGFRRTNAAHDRLARFETHFRRFIDQQMTAAFGPDWIAHQVPGDTRDGWVAKQHRAIEAGEPPRPLIAYADFTDYERLILRTDNWKAVFRPVFRRLESVRESLQRLYPIRICTMHARLITQDDELLLFVEVKRLLKAIGVIG
jgi:hypothetical protein